MAVGAFAIMAHLQEVAFGFSPSLARPVALPITPVV